MCLFCVCFITQSVRLCLPLGYKRGKEHVKLTRHTRGLLCKSPRRRQIVIMSHLKITFRCPGGQDSTTAAGKRPSGTALLRVEVSCNASKADKKKNFSNVKKKHREKKKTSQNSNKVLRPDWRGFSLNWTWTTEPLSACIGWIQSELNKQKHLQGNRYQCFFFSFNSHLLHNIPVCTSGRHSLMLVLPL